MACQPSPNASFLAPSREQCHTIRVTVRQWMSRSWYGWLVRYTVYEDCTAAVVVIESLAESHPPWRRLCPFEKKLLQRSFNEVLLSCFASFGLSGYGFVPSPTLTHASEVTLCILRIARCMDRSTPITTILVAYLTWPHLAYAFADGDQRSSARRTLSIFRLLNTSLPHLKQPFINFLKRGLLPFR